MSSPLFIKLLLEVAPSLNVARNWHWSVKSKHAKATQANVIAALGRKRFDDEYPIEKAIIRVTRFSPGTLDDDNLRGGCKALIDALKVAGIIVDDSPKHVMVDYQQHKVKRGQGYVTVEVW